MCGIAGIWTTAPNTRDRLASQVEKMSEQLRHRGPDSDGVWIDRQAGIALAHRRLSIIDLTEAGSQPMISPSGRYVVTYNGEIYNFVELRGQLEACERRFRGGSDTEVLLHAVEQWGFEDTLERLIGMFAFALWDRQTRQLRLARD